MKAQDLKNSILQLAIQGKLVAQDEHDEPAEVLYAKIQAEKQKLIKEGKIKKDKPLPKITEDEIPFPIPPTWKWVRLGEISDLYTGNSIPKDIKERKYGKCKEGYCYISTKDIEFNQNIQYENGIKIPFNEPNFKYAYKHSILLCIEGGSAGRKIGYLEQTVCFGNKLCCINLFSVFYKYVFFVLQSQYFRGVFNEKIGGIIGGVSISNLKDCVIPLPPLEEQKRIVAKIEELEPLINQYDQAEQELSTLNDKFPEQLKKSILQYAIQGKLVAQDENDEPAEVLYIKIQAEKQKLIKEGKIKKDKPLSPISEDEIPFPIPPTWKWVRLGEIVFKLTDGTHSTPKYTYKGIPFISVKDLSSGYIDFSNTKFISEEEHYQLSQRCHPEQGDLLLTKVGTTGIPVIVNTQREFSLFVSVALLKLSKINVDVEFLRQTILAPFVQEQASNNTKGVGNKNWVIKDIANTIIPLPPLAEQHRIVARVATLLEACDKLHF